MTDTESRQQDESEQTIELTLTTPHEYDHIGSLATHLIESLRDSAEWRGTLPEIQSVELRELDP